MIRRSVRLHFRGQRGFTILELSVALFLMVVIGLGATMASGQVLHETSRNTEYTTASREVMNAIYWMSRDAQMAQVTLGAGDFPDQGDLVFTWTTWENQFDRVAYSVSGGQLKRSYSVDNGLPTETVVAEYINPDPDLTACASDNGVFSLKITATVGEGSREISVTRTHDTTSRPNL
jgi:prepilin-type N-terminal cleavage/methylation domain-containing protein